MEDVRTNFKQAWASGGVKADMGSDSDKRPRIYTITRDNFSPAGIIGEYTEMPIYVQIPKEPNRNIIDVTIIVPNKVVEVTFGDGKKEKMVCNKEDKYDLRQCLFIAIAKHLYKKDYTQEGIEYKANELRYLKEYVKIVDDALKEYNKKCEEVKKLEEEHKAELERIKRKRAKKEAYKARREQKRRDKQIETQKEAYIQAMEYMKNKEPKRNEWYGY